MRRCARCRRPLDGYRRDAIYCCGACRAAASRTKDRNERPQAHEHRSDHLARIGRPE